MSDAAQLHELTAASRLKQIALLTRKNFILQKRRPVATVLEIVVPCLFFLILLAVKSTLSSTTEDPMIYCSFPVSPMDVERPLLDVTNTGNSPKNSAYSCNSGTVWVDFGYQDSNNPYNGIAFAPNTTETRAVMNNFYTWFLKFAENNNDLQNIDLVGFNTAAEISNIENSLTHKFILGVVFQEDDNGSPGNLGFTGTKIHYTFRMPDSIAKGEDGWATNKNFPEFEGLGPRQEQSPYVSSNFVYMQSCMDLAIMQQQKGNLEDLPALFPRLKPFPFPQWEDDPFIFAIRSIFPLILVLSYMYSAISIVRSLVLEKEYRLKEALRMMGVANWVHWFAWFLKSLIFFMISIIVIVVIFSIGKLAQNSDNFYIFMLFLLFSVSTIFFCFMISTLFSSASVASAAGGLLFFLAYFPYFFIAVDYENVSDSAKTGACLLAPTCVGIGARILSQWETSGQGVTSSTVGESPIDSSNISMNTVFGMLIFDCILYMLIAWYVDSIHPGKYGIPKSYFFFLKRSYWCGERRTKGYGGTEHKLVEDNPEDIEPRPEGSEVGIKVEKLVKVFKTVVGKKVAVNNLNVEMCQDQITVLLGHNGAGKTTAMNIMTGMFPPSHGTVYVNGFDVRYETNQVRQSLGLCPQFDVLWEDLTVEEHLRLFGELKGLRGSELERDIDYYIHELNLGPKRTDKTGSLSGGQKRALSVALALVGGSKIIILDEPTSGMDPFKRRQTWDLLLKHKQGRTMLLTTHFMDEADLLGDRIAILSEGRLKACGSSLFLKKRFGVGYHMTLVKDRNCDVNMIEHTVKEHVPSAKLESDSGAELSFLLPQNCTHEFPPLFSQVEKHQGRLGIQSYGVSVTTLEEVFLRVGQGDNALLNERREAVEDEKKRQLSLQMPTEFTKLAGMALIKAQFFAMFKKKYLHSLRHRKSLIALLLLPVLFAIGALSIASSGSSYNEGILPITFATYQPNVAWQSTQNTAGDLFTGAFPQTEALLASSGNSTPLAQTTAFAATMTNFFSSSSLTTGSNLVDRSGINLTALFLEQSADYTSNDFYKDHYVTFSYGDIVIPVRPTAGGDCETYVGGAWATGRSLTGTVGHVYHFRLYSTADNQRVFLTTNAGSPSAGELTQDTYTYKAESRLKYASAYYSPTATTTVTLACDNAAPQTTTFVVSAADPDTIPKTTAFAWFSNQAYHTIPLAVNLADNAILKDFMGSNAYEIYTYNHPLPKSVDGVVDELRTDSSGFNLALFMIFGLGFCAASFCILLITERVNHAKHLQLVSGVSRLIYWSATFIWDFFLLFFVSLVLLVVFAAFDIAAFRGERMGIVFLLLLLFAWAVLPFVYVLSFMFKNSSSGYARMTMMFIFLGMGFLITVFVLKIPSIDLVGVGNVLKVVFSFLPNYAVSQSFLDMYYNYNYNELCNRDTDTQASCQRNGYDYYDNYLDMNDPGVGTACLIMFFSGILYWILLGLIDYGVFAMLARRFQRKAKLGAKDSQLADLPVIERYEGDQSILDVQGLVKQYNDHETGKPKIVVNDLSFRVPKGEVFGLLGVNGAGKSTTFRMLTGEEQPTSGSVSIMGYNIATDTTEARKHIGYCPQYDGLIPTMTGQELLEMFGRLRGIPSDRINGIVQDLIVQFDLRKHSSRLAETYSGGNKRKLSAALAVVGTPDVAFLDEPSSGVDPGARRFLWDALSRYVESGRSIVLTSHSMEECEALCTRLAIMVDGQFMCLGSIQHLKNAFSEGYTMKIKTSPTEDTTNLKAFIMNSFEKCELKEEHNGEATFQIITESRGWPYIFTKLEESKDKVNVTDYSVSQTTLEQVFLSFAKKQSGLEREDSVKRIGSSPAKNRNSNMDVITSL